MSETILSLIGVFTLLFSNTGDYIKPITNNMTVSCNTKIQECKIYDEKSNVKYDFKNSIIYYPKDEIFYDFIFVYDILNNELYGLDTSKDIKTPKIQLGDKKIERLYFLKKDIYIKFIGDKFITTIDFEKTLLNKSIQEKGKIELGENEKYVFIDKLGFLLQNKIYTSYKKYEDINFNDINKNDIEDLINMKKGFLSYGSNDNIYYINKDKELKVFDSNNKKTKKLLDNVDDIEYYNYYNPYSNKIMVLKDGKLYLMRIDIDNNIQFGLVDINNTQMNGIYFNSIGIQDDGNNFLLNSCQKETCSTYSLKIGNQEEENNNINIDEEQKNELKLINLEKIIGNNDDGEEKSIEKYLINNSFIKFGDGIEVTYIDQEYNTYEFSFEGGVGKLSLENDVNEIPYDNEKFIKIGKNDMYEISEENNSVIFYLKRNNNYLIIEVNFYKEIDINKANDIYKKIIINSNSNNLFSNSDKILGFVDLTGFLYQINQLKNSDIIKIDSVLNILKENKKELDLSNGTFFYNNYFVSTKKGMMYYLIDNYLYSIDEKFNFKKINNENILFFKIINSGNSGNFLYMLGIDKKIYRIDLTNNDILDTGLNVVDYNDEKYYIYNDVIIFNENGNIVELNVINNSKRILIEGNVIYSIHENEITTQSSIGELEDLKNYNFVLGELKEIDYKINGIITRDGKKTILYDDESYKIVNNNNGVIEKEIKYDLVGENLNDYFVLVNKNEKISYVIDIKDGNITKYEFDNIDFSKIYKIIYIEGYGVNYFSNDYLFFNSNYLDDLIIEGIYQKINLLSIDINLLNNNFSNYIEKNFYLSFKKYIKDDKIFNNIEKLNKRLTMINKEKLENIKIKVLEYLEKKYKKTNFINNEKKLENLIYLYNILK